MKIRLTATIGTRISKAMRTAFVRKAKKELNMDQSEVLRELVHAYVEERIVVKPVVQSTLGESK
jgi:hypothetical protein